MIRNIEKYLIFVFALALTLNIVSPAVQAQGAECIITGTVTYNGDPCSGAMITGGGQTTYSTGGGFYFFMLPTGINTSIVATLNGHSASSDPFTTYDGQPKINLAITGPPLPTPTPDPNSTPTPTATTTPTNIVGSGATPIPHPASNNQPAYNPGYIPPATPTPTPSTGTDLAQLDTSSITPRKVFSSPKWVNDHETITVTNNGDPITVLAWINDESNNLAFPIAAGALKSVSTPSILTQDNEIVTVGYDAYQSGVKIDSFKATIGVNSGTPTPAASATTTRSPGFTTLIALACILGMAVFLTRKRMR